MTHYDEITCLLYLEGQLEASRAMELSAHLEICAECQHLLGALEQESRLLAASLAEEDEAVPARLLAQPDRQATPWAWVFSLGMALAGLYTLWTGLVEPWLEQFSQVGFGGSNLLAVLFFSGALWGGWEDMIRLMQFLAAGTLTILGISVLRRTWKKLTPLSLVLGVLVLMLAFPSAVGAAEVKRIGNYTLAEGETQPTDLIIMAGTLRIEGTVEGDLIFFGQSVTVTGRVTGDVIAFARLARISGQVDGNVRVFANSVSLERGSRVGKNVMTFVENFDLEREAEVRGSVNVFAESATVNGHTTRDLMLYAKRAQLDGFVGGNAQFGGGALTIGATAEIQGTAKFRGDRQPQVSEGAKLASPLSIEIEKRRADYTSPRFYWGQALRWGAAFLFGLVAALLLPGFFRDVVRANERYGPALGIGLVGLVAIPVLAILICCTLVGIPIGMAMILIYLIALYAAQTFVGAWLGTKLLGEPDGRGALFGRLALGLVVIRVLGHIPKIGWLVWLVVIIFGLGALTLASYQRMQRQPVPAV